MSKANMGGEEKKKTNNTNKKDKCKYTQTHEDKSRIISRTVRLKRNNKAATEPTINTNI